jgi:hypothetical protein
MIIEELQGFVEFSGFFPNPDDTTIKVGKITAVFQCQPEFTAGNNLFIYFFNTFTSSSFPLSISKSNDRLKLNPEFKSE